ncbi:hypothetical protein B296_00003099 [Ensete ventricosum]|uniref:Uncharacterized protein n=1 Tax=Ensete ventricosum TaxID=4639 RepID=A0A427AND5_ENSVE|nr:hypothetical protein B296_00003099 [Ensete ventricosum]
MPQLLPCRSSHLPLPSLTVGTVFFQSCPLLQVLDCCLHPVTPSTANPQPLSSSSTNHVVAFLNLCRFCSTAA